MVPGTVIKKSNMLVISYHFEFLKSIKVIELVTIFVSGKSEETLRRLGIWAPVYEAGIILWIIFGLGYIFMLINIITGTL